MADNLKHDDPGSGPSVATDEVAGVHRQRCKIAFGAGGSAADVAATTPLPLVFGLTSTVQGASTFRTNALSSTTPEVIKATSGRLVRLEADNPNAQTAWIQLFDLAIQTQSLVPTADDTVGAGWERQDAATINLYQSIDEGTTSPDDDTTYIIDPAGGADPYIVQFDQDWTAKHAIGIRLYRRGSGTGVNTTVTFAVRVNGSNIVSGNQTFSGGGYATSSFANQVGNWPAGTITDLDVRVSNATQPAKITALQLDVQYYAVQLGVTTPKLSIPIPPGSTGRTISQALKRYPVSFSNGLIAFASDAPFGGAALSSPVALRAWYR